MAMLWQSEAFVRSHQKGRIRYCEIYLITLLDKVVLSIDAAEETSSLYHFESTHFKSWLESSMT